MFYILDLAYVESFEGKHALWLKQIATGSLIQLVPPAPVGYWGIAFARCERATPNPRTALVLTWLRREAL